MACATTGVFRLVKLRRFRGQALTGRARSGQALADIRQQQDGYKHTPDFTLKHCRHFDLFLTYDNYNVLARP